MFSFIVPLALLNMIRNRERCSPRVACLCAVSAFTTKAILFGAMLSVSSNFLWAFGIALCLASSLPERAYPGKSRLVM
ncbi:MAG: hypothetical protein PS018_14205 [bacterium]|nr:hypothetical protein [bacterium]